MDIKTDVEQNFVSFIREAKGLGKGIMLAPYSEIIFAGMGGSGIAGDVLKIFIKDRPFSVVHDYTLPAHAGMKTLVFVSTYSGNTEEMISVYNEALKKRCQIVVITSGEKMRERCRKDKVPYIKIPSGIQPRATLPYLIIPVLNLIDFKDWDLNKLVDAVSGAGIREKAKELAEKLVDKIPLIYSSHVLYPVAYRWKTQFNENTKIHAFSNEFPELNHNELEAYENIKGSYYVIIIRDESDSLKIKERMDFTKGLIMKKGVSVTEIAISGKNRFNKVMTEIYLGDLVSIYLAELYGVDPTPVALIEQFKKQLR
jgi:glucose/mannose-6-phosphate isomerase